MGREQAEVNLPDDDGSINLVDSALLEEGREPSECTPALGTDEHTTHAGVEPVDRQRRS
jgi:hypothetical protein